MLEVRQRRAPHPLKLRVEAVAFLSSCFGEQQQNNCQNGEKWHRGKKNSLSQCNSTSCYCYKEKSHFFHDLLRMWWLAAGCGNGFGFFWLDFDNLSVWCVFAESWNFIERARILTLQWNEAHKVAPNGWANWNNWMRVTKVIAPFLSTSISLSLKLPFLKKNKKNKK